MQLNINGQTHEVADGKGRLLLWVLRDELGLTGGEVGCGAGLCGMCTVLVDGAATRACITPLVEVDGKQIRTFEAMVTHGRLRAIQQAFLEEQVLQCGWCAVGQMMTAAAFLAANPHPTDDEIIDAMTDNFCRCAAYSRIRRAVKRAAGAMRPVG